MELEEIAKVARIVRLREEQQKKRAMEPAEILRQAKLKPGQTTLLAGGPPCQPFSKSGYWCSGDSGRLKDPRASTLKAYLKIVEAAMPKVFVLENVEGLAFDG
jgi:DNA (cytosine-5)-methyltransferase 1